MQFGGAFLDIILLALAVVAVLKLRSVLGRRPDSVYRSQEADAPIVDLKKKSDKPSKSPEKESPSPQPEKIFSSPFSDSVDGKAQRALEKISAAEPSFRADSFIKGAAQAYKMIVTAFADGEKATLGRLLSKDVYEQFAQSLEARESKGEDVSVEIKRLLEARIMGAELARGTAKIRMRFRTEQISYVKDSEGRVIEGDPNRVQAKTDLWVFARRLGAADPSWALAATGA